MSELPRYVPFDLVRCLGTSWGVPLDVGSGMRSALSETVDPESWFIPGAVREKGGDTFSFPAGTLAVAAELMRAEQEPPETHRTHVHMEGWGEVVELRKALGEFLLRRATQQGVVTEKVASEHDYPISVKADLGDWYIETDTGEAAGVGAGDVVSGPRFRSVHPQEEGTLQVVDLNALEEETGLVGRILEALYVARDTVGTRSRVAFARSVHRVDDRGVVPEYAALLAEAASTQRAQTELGYIKNFLASIGLRGLLERSGRKWSVSKSSTGYFGHLGECQGLSEQVRAVFSELSTLDHDARLSLGSPEFYSGMADIDPQTVPRQPAWAIYASKRLVNEQQRLSAMRDITDLIKNSRFPSDSMDFLQVAYPALATKLEAFQTWLSSASGGGNEAFEAVIEVARQSIYDRGITSRDEVVQAIEHHLRGMNDANHWEVGVDYHGAGVMRITDHTLGTTLVAIAAARGADVESTVNLDVYGAIMDDCLKESNFALEHQQEKTKQAADSVNDLNARLKSVGITPEDMDSLGKLCAMKDSNKFEDLLAISVHALALHRLGEVDITTPSFQAFLRYVTVTQMSYKPKKIQKLLAWLDENAPAPPADKSSLPPRRLGHLVRNFNP